MERNIQKNGLVNLLVLVGVGAAAFAAARYANSLAGQAVTAFLGLGVLAAAVSWFQMGLEERERLERLEFDEATRGAGGAALFQTQESETFPARRSREQFEKYFVPGFSLLLFGLQAAGAFWLWRWLDHAALLPLNQPLVAGFCLALGALVLFILGRYSASLARLENVRLLTPGASYLLLSAYLTGSVVVGFIAVESGFPKIDFYFARLICALLALLAVENIITLVLEIYRPRVKGKVERLLYESRLVGLLSRPEGIFTTAAHALDYQFGFKVSETWFYKFLQKAFAWLVLAQLGILLLSTCFVFIEVGEQALLERFGKPVGAGVIGPGPHLKFPWPMDKVYRFRTEEIQTFNIGHEHEEKHGEKGDHDRLTLWTVSHTKEEFLLLVASREPTATSTNQTDKKSPPVNFLASNIPVQYQVTNLVAWAYTHRNPAELLKHIGTRETVRYLVNADVQDITSTGRFKASAELRQRIQARADELRLGVKIIFVGLQDIHPPVKVAAAYEAVVGAKLKREAALLAAEAYRAQTNALASAEALRRTREAEAESQRVSVGALARVALFTNQMTAYLAAPEVYAQRAYLQTLTRGGGGARKYILATTNTQDVIQFNLEEKIREDLLNIAIPTVKPK
jgi:regulator of protease activity HflC (stomatin/prohibitin superfamily)